MSSEYILLPFGNISLTETDRTEELARRARGQIKSYAKELPEEDIVIRYFFLVNEESNYVGMAQRFQEHLVNKYDLKRQDPRTDIRSTWICLALHRCGNQSWESPGRYYTADIL